MSTTDSSMSAFLRSATLLVLVAALVGCADDPPISIRYELSTGPAQKCHSPTCIGIELDCETVLSVRIVDPRSGQEVFSVCRKLESAENLCKMTSVRLVSENELPARRLAVQVAVYKADHVQQSDGTYSCPTDLAFDGNRFALTSPTDEKPPAVAGMGYYEPGDAETVIRLGCANLPIVNTPECRGENNIKVTASADDFDTGVFLQQPNNIKLWVGEPVGPDQFQIVYSKMDELKLVDPNAVGPSAWNGFIKKTASPKSLCLVVDEKAAGATASVRCIKVKGNETQFDLRGLRLSNLTLRSVLGALGYMPGEFPPKGLVVGMVVDAQGKPMSGVRVQPSSGSVQYLGPTRDGLIDTGTSPTGIFISQDVPYESSWSAPGTSGGYGGVIPEHVTVVILQPDAAATP